MKALFRKMIWRPTLIYSALAALLFSIGVLVYVREGSYEETWIVYCGNFAFMLVMLYHALHDSKIRGNNESTVALVFSCHVATIIGIIISTLLSFIILTVFVPGYIGTSRADVILQGEPANVIHDNTDGMGFIIYMCATVINFSVGSFCGIIIPFTAKRDQRRDSKDPAPLHQRGAK